MDKEVYNLFYVRCDKDEFVWANEDILTQNFVYFDAWLRDSKVHKNYKTGNITERNWIIRKFVDICKDVHQKERFNSLCFIRKKNSSVQGALSIAPEIANGMSENMKYVVYDQSTQQILDDSGKQINDLEGKVCIVHDVLYNGDRLLEAQEHLAKRKADVIGAVMIHDYGMQRPDFSFPIKFAIDGEPFWASQRHLNIRHDEEILRAKNNGRHSYHINLPEGETYGQHIAFELGMSYLPGGVMRVPDTAIKIFDKRGIKYELVDSIRKL